MVKTKSVILIKRYFLRCKTIKEIENKLEKYYVESAPSYGMAHKWFIKFRCGRTATTSSAQEGRLR